VRLGTRMPFETAEDVMWEMLGFAISRSGIDRYCKKVGNRIDALRKQRDDEFLEPVSPLKKVPEPLLQPKRLALLADATVVLTVAGEEHKSVHCGRAFDLGDRGVKDDSLRPFLVNSQVCASGENMEDFSNRFKALALESGLRNCPQVGFLGDGATCLWKLAEDKLPSGSVLIQDFWHVCEHLSQLAKELFEGAWESWFERWKICLREGFVDELILELKRFRKRFRTKKRSLLISKINYLCRGKHRMDYARFKREGWPIGSGAIESTCKRLIKTRFNVTGARWRRCNILPMTALRVSLANKTFAKDWESIIAA